MKGWRSRWAHSSVEGWLIVWYSMEYWNLFWQQGLLMGNKSMGRKYLCMPSALPYISCLGYFVPKLGLVKEVPQLLACHYLDCSRCLDSWLVGVIWLHFPAEIFDPSVTQCSAKLESLVDWVKESRSMLPCGSVWLASPFIPTSSYITVSGALWASPK